MEKKDFLTSCETIGSLHFPRWNELPEFELYMDQVIALAEKYLSALSPDNKGLLTPSMINNYVKSGVLPPPKNKKYNRTHLAMLMIICAMKSVLEISAISDIIGKSIAAGNIENVLDTFAEMYETALAKSAKKAHIAAAASESDHILGMIAIENALHASAARTVAMHAYKVIESGEISREEMPKQRSDKAEKKAAKAKKEASEKEENQIEEKSPAEQE